MRTVFLDKATLGNDISYKNIEDIVDITYFDNTLPEQVPDRIADAEIIVTNKVYIGKVEMQNALKLKLICVAATGYNNVDISQAAERNIVVTNVKSYSADSVAQQVFSHILTIYNSIVAVQDDIKSGKWQNSQIFTMLDRPFIELKNKKIGIIGYGAIGKKVARIAEAFGMQILVCESFKASKTENINRIPFDDLISESDIISVHVPLNKDTENLIAAKDFKRMKNTALVINTARGGIINEKDLYYALVNKEIAYAATDVLTVEPPFKGNILFEAPNIVITPHTAWTSYESRLRLLSGITDNILKFKGGKISEINLW